MYCKKCGTTIGDNDKFCMKCGQEQYRICPTCHQKNPTAAAFCRFCGQNMKEDQPSQKSSNILKKRIEFVGKEKDNQKKYAINNWLNQTPIKIHAVGFAYSELVRLYRRDRVVLEAVTFEYTPSELPCRYLFDFYEVTGKTEELQAKIDRTYADWQIRYPDYTIIWKDQAGTAEDGHLCCLLAKKK